MNKIRKTLILFTLLPIIAQAGDFALSAGVSSGAYAFDPNNVVLEASWRPSEKWDVSVGYIAKQDEPCNTCENGGLVYFIRPDGTREYVTLTGTQDADPYGYLSGTRVFSYRVGDLRLFTGGGLMLATETNVLISRAVNISLHTGIEYGRVCVQYRHFSNGGTQMPNYGQNLLLIGWNF